MVFFCTFEKLTSEKILWTFEIFAQHL